MKQYFTLIFIFLFTGCTTGDYTSIVNAAISRNPTVAFESYARHKTIQYAVNPKRLKNDLKFLSHFMNNISKQWGDNNIRVPRKKEYVKYMQNYKSRALIDFDKGIITVETLADKKSLKNAIVTTLLLPDDPRGADLFNAKKVKLGSTPYLLGEVKDDQNKNIRYVWRANRYASILLKKNYGTKSIQKGRKNIKVNFVEFPMVKDHADIRVRKFKPYIKKYARDYGVSENLVYAIIKTESNFNQFAVSNAGAYGLMQIVPKSAGKDAYKYIKGKDISPSKSYLFDAKNNIELGVAYLDLLDKKYLYGIKNPISKEYCIISAYNTGSGNVLKTFAKDKSRAKRVINSKKPSEVYDILRANLPYAETRRYLKKVIFFKRDFVSL
jgi:membrane-bound lytic murein transglycosylase C